MNIIKYAKWRRTDTLVKAGQNFLKDGFYCPFPEDTLAYDEYWDEQEHLVKNGYDHEGLRMSGLEHLYTNFCPIWNKRKKRHIFPDFRAVDNDWYTEIESVMGIGPYQKDDYRPVGHVTGKTRQSGHSLKAVVPVVYNMHFVPGSKNFIGAYLKKQAQKTNAMYQAYHNHIFEHTAWGKRYIKRDAGEYYKTGYLKNVNGLWIEKGYLSELSITAFSDSTEKGVGGGVDLFILEESGAFPNLLEAVQFIKNACKDGDYTTGTILAYGAAGKLDSAKDLEELFYNATDYDFKGYDNVWDDYVPSGKKVGYFVPNYSCRPPHIDADGNPDEEAAVAAKEKALANLKKTNYEKYLQEASQMPNSPKEMFAVRQKLRHDVEVTEPHLTYLLAHADMLGDPVDLMMDTELGRPVWKFSDKRPIHDWPTHKLADKEGVPLIYDYPDPNAYPGRYIAAIDSYNQDDASTDSLGSMLVFDREIRAIVAEIYQRPQTKPTFYRNCLYMQLIYNAKALVENEDQELVPWYYNKGFEHMLADRPDLIRQIIPGTQSRRTKGIHAAVPLIKAAENKINMYITEQIGIVRNDKGDPIGEKLGISRIRSIGVAREVSRYVSDPSFNFDRYRTLGWLLLYEEETFLEAEKQNTSDAAANFLMRTNKLGRAATDIEVIGGGSMYQLPSGIIVPRS